MYRMFVYSVYLFSMHEGKEKGKKERKKEEVKKEKNKLEIFTLIFLIVRRINETLGLCFTSVYLRVLIYRSFASLCYVYLGAALIP